jgi:hypothetical protein
LLVEAAKLGSSGEQVESAGEQFASNLPPRLQALLRPGQSIIQFLPTTVCLAEGVGHVGQAPPGHAPVVLSIRA